jgi:hypothetical protein
MSTGTPGPLTLRSDEAEVTILPGKGADIYAFTDRRTGTDVLFKSPWGTREAGPWPRAATSMERWIEAYAGGWQVLLPNGGTECTERGTTWGYHGEAAVAAWQVLDATAVSARLETRLFSVPLHVRREFTLTGPVLRLTETVTNESPADLEVMWVHHPAFGPPFLERGCVLSAGCGTVLADDEAPGTLLAAASTHSWPHAVAADGGPLDLRIIPGPEEPRAVLAYLSDFSSGYFAITNPRLRLGFGLRWPLDVFPHAWFWQEMAATPDWPWYQRAYVAAIEPASTIPGQGMSAARAKGHPGVSFAGGQTRQVVIEAVLFESGPPEGGTEVTGIAEGGRVQLAATEQKGPTGYDRVLSAFHRQGGHRHRSGHGHGRGDRPGPGRRGRRGGRL